MGRKKDKYRVPIIDVNEKILTAISANNVAAVTSSHYSCPDGEPWGTQDRNQMPIILQSAAAATSDGAPWGDSG